MNLSRGNGRPNYLQDQPQSDSTCPNRAISTPGLWSLLYNEWRFYRVQPLCWLALLLSLAFATLATVGQDLQTAQPQKELLFSHTKLLMMLQVLLIGVLAPLAFLRERNHGMAELIGVTPLTDRQWCFSRAGGLLLLVLAVQMILQFLAGAAVWWGHDLTVTPITVRQLCWMSLQLFLLQQLPAILLLVALQLWCSRKTQQVALLYLLSAICWLSYPLLAAATGSPVMANSQQISPWLSQLMLYLDPYALTPWLAQLQNDPSLTPGLPVLCNRLLILCLSLLLLWRALMAGPLVIGSRSQSMANLPPIMAKSTPLAQNTPVASLPSSAEAPSGRAKPRPSRLSLNADWQSFLSLLQLQWLHLWRQRSTWLAMILLAGLAFSEVFTGLGYAESLSRLQPDSRDALNRINWDLVPRFGLLLVAFWASQLSWLHRQLRCDSLIAATPVSAKVQLCSQLVTLWLLAMSVILVSFSAVAVAQLLISIPIKGTEYLQQGLFSLLPLLCWSMLFLACHAGLRSPLQANSIVVILLLLALSPLPQMLELQHPLWIIGQTQLQMPDALWAYQGSLGGTPDQTALSFGGDFSHGGFWPYLLFWALLALTLWTLALQGYHRGTGQSAPRQILSKPLGLSAVVLALLWLTQGLHIHRQLQLTGALEPHQQQQAQRATYEKNYQHWRAAPQPVVSHLLLEADLQPTHQQADILATLTLTNPHPVAINQLLLTLPGNLADRQALHDLQLADADLLPPSSSAEPLLYQFHQPLTPGASVKLRFKLHLQQKALAPASAHQILRPEFSYLRLLHLMPQVGFIPELRLRDAKVRAKYGLAPLPVNETQPSVLAGKATPATARYDWTPLETILSVPHGYQGLAAGALTRQWQHNHKEYFHYRTSAAVRNLPTLIAVPWQPQTRQHRNIRLEIYSPEYNQATDLTLQAMQQTLSWFEQQIGAYPGDALRLVIMPDIGPTGYALPQFVLINHRVGVRAFPAPNAGFSQIYRRAVHEVAHQWFGHGIGNGVPGDSAFLVESLAKYAELVLLEQHFGQQAMQSLVEFERERYRRAHLGSRAEPKSLIDADESYDQYSRATLVFAHLRAQLGDEVILKALREVWQQHRYPAQPASAMDFVRALQAHSPQQALPLINTLLLSQDNRLLLQ